MSDYIEPHWGSAALVVIDVQRDFLDGGASPIPGTTEVVPALASLVDVFRAANRPVVHVVRLYEPGGSDVDPVRRAAVEAGARIAAPGSDGSQLVSEIVDTELDHELLLTGAPQDIGPGEVVVYKPRWSAFHRTGLDAWLRERGCDTVVVAGCNLPNCPRATLFDASERDYRAVLVTDAVSQVTQERLDDLAAIGVQLVTTADVLSQR